MYKTLVYLFIELCGSFGDTSTKIVRERDDTRVQLRPVGMSQINVGVHTYSFTDRCHELMVAVDGSESWK
jgi:hypothetical protein